MNTRKLEVWILLADLACIGVAFLGADLLRFGLTWDPDEVISIHALLPFALATCFIWIALSVVMQMDGFRGGWKLSAVFSHLLLGTSCTFALLLALGYLTRSYVSRLALSYFMLLLVAGFLGVRCLARLMLRWRHEEGDVWRVVIIGSGRVAQGSRQKLNSIPKCCARLWACYFPTRTRRN